MSRARNWCFILNNYSTDEQLFITAFYLEKVCYLLFGRETGEEGIPHLQGYFKATS